MAEYGALEFLDLRYRPKPTELCVEYRVTPARGMTLRRVCEYIAGESSIGTWTDIQTLNARIARTLKPHVYWLDPRQNRLKVAYPLALFEPGNLPEILSSIAGNIYGMKAIDALRLEDIHFPREIVRSFRGPNLGIPGVRKLYPRTKGRPLVGTILKPKVGLTAQEYARFAYESWRGGLDIVKDDENLSSMSFNNFYKRMELVFRMKRKVERETGERKIFLANATAETMEMLRRAKCIIAHGGEFVMVDILTVGWAGVQTLRDAIDRKPVALHGHRAMHGIFTRLPNHGMSMLAIAKLARMVGIDTLHIGTAAVGKMHGSRSAELLVEEEITAPRIAADDTHAVLSQEWYGVKPSMPVASGGLHPGMLPKVVSIMGSDIVFQAGGGVHGHPWGSRAGGAAMRQAAEATMRRIPLARYAQTHPELNAAIEKWGVVR